MNFQPPSSQTENGLTLQWKIHPGKVIQFLTGCVILILVLDLTGWFCWHVLKFRGYFFYQFVRLFHVDLESNISSFYSALTLLFSGLVLAVISRVKQQMGDSYRHHWRFLSWLFLFFSVDEIASLHEMLTLPIRRTFHPSGLFYYAWIIPGIFFVLAVGMAYWKFLMHLPSKIKFLFITAAVIFLTGALGVDALGGYYRELHGRAGAATYAILAMIEETLEMTGVLIFIYALLNYLQSLVKEIKLTLPE